MTKLEADQIAAAMKKEGWTDVRVEPSVGDGYVGSAHKTEKIVR